MITLLIIQKVEDGLTVGFVKSAMNYFKQPWKHIPLGTTIDIPPRGETSFSNLEYELDMPKEEADLIASAGKDVEFVSFDPNYKYTDVCILLAPLKYL